MEETNKKVNGREQYTIAKWYQRLLGYIIDISYIMLIIEVIGEEYRVDKRGIAILILFLYPLLTESIFGRTFGKIITCTTVRKRANLKTADFWTVLLRTVCRFIPLDGISYCFTQTGCWHDILSNTVVVNSNIYSILYKKPLLVISVP